MDNLFSYDDLPQDDIVLDAWRLYEQMLLNESDDDYVVNKEQMDKFAAVVKFFIKCAHDCFGVIDPIDIQPRKTMGDVTAFFPVLHLSGEDLKGFSKIITYLSALSIDPGDGEMFCISVTVPNVFVKKKR